MRGGVAIESVVGLGLASITLTALVVLFTNVSHTALRISQAHRDVIATTKGFAALSSALRARERNRLPFAIQITQGARPQTAHGGEHPLSRATGGTAPRADSDIISVVDVAQRCRGVVTRATIEGSAITAMVCGLPCRIGPDEFKSYLLYAIDGARQIIGDIIPTSTNCVEVRGTTINGLVTATPSFTSSPLVFAPVEREYSLFVDSTGTLRIASHVGFRVVENQPIARGIAGFTIQKVSHALGVTPYTVEIRPLAGKPFSSIIVPGLAERGLWNEILP